MIVSDMFYRVACLSVALVTLGAGVFSWRIYHSLSDPVSRVPALEAIAASVGPAQVLPVASQSPAAPDPRWKGIVLVVSRTDSNGQVIEAVPILGDEEFWHRAVEAAYKMRFARQKLNGRYVGTIGHTSYRFIGGGVEVSRLSRFPDDGQPLGPPESWYK